MSQPIPIVADPISSDGSEESWILLDEMDEAMREEFNGASNLSEMKNEETTATSSEAAIVDESSSPEIDMVTENDEPDGDDDDDDGGPVLVNQEEPSVDYPSNIETMSSAAEAISACPSNDDDDDDVNDTEHLRRFDMNFYFSASVCTVSG